MLLFWGRRHISSLFFWGMPKSFRKIGDGPINVAPLKKINCREISDFFLDSLLCTSDLLQEPIV